MSIKAPLCSYDGCRNSTWDGLCYAHIGATSAAPGSPFVGRPVRASKIPDASVPEVWSDVSNVFTDVDDVVSVNSIRDQIRATVTAAVSLEAYRHFKKIDVADPNQRNRMALMLRQTISQQMTPEAISISRGDAIDLINSSSDEFGRSIDDSAGLISYGLVKEWQMGRANAGALSPDGTPYDNGADDFITVVSTGEMQSIINKQFGRELSRFDSIVTETTGSHAKNQSLFHPSLTVTDEELNLESTYYAEQRAQEEATRLRVDSDRRAAAAAQAQLIEQQTQAERARVEYQNGAAERNAKTKRIIGGLGALAGIAINASVENGQRKAEQRSRDEQRERNRDWDHLRQTMQDDADEKNRRKNR